MKMPDFAKYFLGFQNSLLEHDYAINSKDTYREGLIQLIYFMEEVKKINQFDLWVKDITLEVVDEFLDWLKTVKGCCARTRNNRLAAIRRFFRYVCKDNPDYVHEFQRIKTIARAKIQKKVKRHLVQDEVKLLLEQPDQITEKGRRNLILLALMYDTGARVQEIINLTLSCLDLNHHPTVNIEGKGKKLRTVFISERLVEHIQFYLKQHSWDLNQISREEQKKIFLFPNCTGERLTRATVNRILKKYLQTMKTTNPLFNTEGISCHSMRHSRITHFVEEGMPLLYVSYFVDHEQETTTAEYGHVAFEQKRQAWLKAHKDVIFSQLPKWKDLPNLISLSRRM